MSLSTYKERSAVFTNTMTEQRYIKKKYYKGLKRTKRHHISHLAHNILNLGINRNTIGQANWHPRYMW